MKLITDTKAQLDILSGFINYIILAALSLVLIIAFAPMLSMLTDLFSGVYNPEFTGYTFYSGTILSNITSSVSGWYLLITLVSVSALAYIIIVTIKKQGQSEERFNDF